MLKTKRISNGLEFTKNFILLANAKLTGGIIWRGLLRLFAKAVTDYGIR
jgi:hypothetical protein